MEPSESNVASKRKNCDLDDQVSDSDAKKKRMDKPASVLKKESAMNTIMYNVRRNLVVNARMNNEIEENEKRINESHSAQFDDFEKKIEDIEKQKADLNVSIYLEKSDATTKIWEKYKDVKAMDETAVKELLLIINDGIEIFFPLEASKEGDSLVGYLKEISGHEITKTNYYEMLGVKEENRIEFRQFVIEEIDIVKTRAIVPLAGKVKGYKGAETTFSFDDEEDIKVIDYPDAVASDSIDWSSRRWNNVKPKKENIRWHSDDDDEEQWAFSEVKMDVWVVKMKNVDFDSEK